MSDICGYENTTTDSPCQNPTTGDNGRCWIPSHNPDSDEENPQGAGTKLTKDRQEGMASMIEQGHSQAAAARAYGIHPDTFTNWLRRGEDSPESIFGEFFGRIARAKSVSECQYVDSLRHMAEEIKDTDTLRWMLQQRFAESWGESDALGGAGTSNGQPLIPDDDQLEAILEDLDEWR